MMAHGESSVLVDTNVVSYNTFFTIRHSNIPYT